MSKAILERSKPEVGQDQRAFYSGCLRSFDLKKRTIEFVASTETVDRYGDIIRVAGWKLDQYKKNPVFLFGHRSDEPPIGRSLEVTVERNPKPALVQLVEFVARDIYPFADMIFQMYANKFMSAVSVGFRPLAEPKMIFDEEEKEFTGYEFIDQELMELSAVPIPANPDALARGIADGTLARALGFGNGSMGRKNRAMLDEFTLLLTKCGAFKNPAWIKLVPGVTYSLPSETPTAEPEDEGEVENEGAIPEKKEAFPVQEITEKLADVINRLCKTDENITTLEKTSVRKADLAESLQGIENLRVRLEIVVTAVKTVAEAVLTKAEMAEVMTPLDGLRKRMEILQGEVVTHADETQTRQTMEEIRGAVERLAGSVVKQKEVGDLAAKLLATREALDRLSGLVAKSPDQQEALSLIGELRSRLESIGAGMAKSKQLDEAVLVIGELRTKIESQNATMVKAAQVADLEATIADLDTRLSAVSDLIAKQETITEVQAKVEELRARLEGMAATVATKADIAELNSRFDEGCKRLDSMVEKIVQLAVVIKQRGTAPAAESCLCPYTDDQIEEALRSAWDPQVEAAKQALPVGWRRMALVVIGDSQTRTSYKLIHHASNFQLVPAGVRSALENFEQTPMPESERDAARSHLVRHQSKIAAKAGLVFDQDSFERQLGDLGRVYRNLEAQGDVATLPVITDQIKKAVEAICPVEKPQPKLNPVSEFENALLK